MNEVVRVPCTSCGTLVLSHTGQSTGGYCVPCSRIRNLLPLLVALETLLHRHGERKWATWVASCRGLANASYQTCAVELLSGFGGMGSLNDLVFHPLNGHLIEDDELEPANEELKRLRYDVARIAQTILDRHLVE